MRTLLVVIVLTTQLVAQETRGKIHGRVVDPSSAPVAGAAITVTNSDTGVTLKMTTNETGYYEANLLLPGQYQVAAEAQGFKRSERKGLTLVLNAQLAIDLRLELGAVNETISVTAQAPLLDTSTASSGMVMDNRSVLDLPVIADNTMVLIKLTPGVQTSGVNDYLGPHSNAGASDFGVNGRVGGNEYSIDGAPNNGAGRRTAYLPHADTVSEMKVETSGFDASVGHTTGVSVALMTKAGTNRLHGTVTEQHWQQRWHGTPFFTKQLYYRNIAAAEAAGNTALASELRSKPKQEPGRSNNWAVTAGGPIVIPKIINGRNKLFFFASYQGNRDVVSDLPSRLNKTIPTLDDRRGDFSRFLGVNAGLYQLYDPLSVRPDPDRRGNFIRSPIPGNVLPASRIVNPARDFYTKILPTPNNDNNPRLEPRNNFLAITTRLIRDYKAYTNRIDYQLSNSHRFFGRWTYNDWINNANDWTYDSFRGLMATEQQRTNLAGTVDWVWTISPTTMLDIAVAVNDYREGNRLGIGDDFKPTDVGLPAYLDAKAGDQHVLPQMSVGGYEAMGWTYPAYTWFRSTTLKADLSKIRGNHTMRFGFDGRGQYRNGGGGGNTSGSFSFDNRWTRKNDDNFTPAGTLAHSWASFLMGIPAGMSIATNDSYAMLNPFYSWYAQDNWRVSRKLSLNLGLRMEYELGPNERYDRLIGWFDSTAQLPIASGAQAAYARTPIAELPASQFTVQGGSVYPNVNGASRRIWRNELMWLPRAAFAYAVDAKTVVRGGYGIFYDTLNVLNEGPDQTGFSRATSTIISNDFGVNWLVGDPGRGVPPISDPFPVRANGTRFDEPLRSSLGAMSRAGRGWSFADFNLRHARQQRWRIGIQRQITTNVMVDVAYSGSYSDRVPLTRTLSPLPEQFWATGNRRNDQILSNMNANVTNPFRITNFDALRTSDPVLYQDLSTQGFFTSPTIRRNQLLRAFPHMNGLNNDMTNVGKVRSHGLETVLQKRFAKGFMMNFGYTYLRTREADFFWNEFDIAPTYRESNDARPHRITGTGIYELPFGRGRKWLQTGALNHITGGWQIAATYEFQPGPLVGWGNLFYEGNIDNIRSGEQTLGRWFNTDGFVRPANAQPGAFHVRVFPTRIDGLRADFLNQWNANLQRDVRFTERIALQLRFEAINVSNRTQFAGPDVSPTSTNFGVVTSQTNTRNRFIQIQGRLRF